MNSTLKTALVVLGGLLIGVTVKGYMDGKS